MQHSKGKSQRMNRWVSPEPRMRTENEFSPENAVPYTPASSFDTIRKQVKKKKPTRKSKRDRVSAKSVSLAERLGNGESDWTT